MQWMNKPLYNQQVKSRVNPTVGHTREKFLPVWAFNAAGIRYQNCDKSWAINITIDVGYREGIEILEIGKEMKISP